MVLDLLAELAREEGAAALVVSHDPASARVADRVVQVRDGRIGEERTGSEDTVVIGRGGWLRVPEESLRAAGIGERALVRVRGDAVELRPVADAVAAAEVVQGEAPVTAPGALVEARGVTRRFGHEVALERFDGVFPPGTLTVVTGPSGSGKSTLLALLAGLDTPDEGEVLVDGVAFSDLDREGRAAFRRERIGVVGQLPGLSGVLTARENVELPLAFRDVEGLEARERAMDALGDRRARRPCRARSRPALGRRAGTCCARPCDRRPPRRPDRGRADRAARQPHHARGRRSPRRSRAGARDDGDLRDARPHPRHARGRRDRPSACVGPATIDLMASASDTVLVSGIRCERCVMRLATALEGQPGLEAAHANLMGEVTLTWDDEVTSRDALLGTLAGAGFHERVPA